MTGITYNKPACIFNCNCDDCNPTVTNSEQAITGTGDTQAVSNEFLTDNYYDKIYIDNLSISGGSVDLSNYYTTGQTNNLFAPLISPILSGTPIAPTANGGTNNNQIATTAFVQSAIPGIDSSPTSGSSSPVSSGGVYNALLNKQNIITTGLTVPKIIGGTGSTSILTLQGTSISGTSTSPAIQFKVGNSGATIAQTILNNGWIGFGSGNTAPTTPFSFLGDFVPGVGSAVFNSTSIAVLAVNGAIGNSSGFYLNEGGLPFWKFINNDGDANKLNIISSSSADNTRLTITQAGNIGFGTTTPTSTLHLKAGSATAGTAPLGFTSGPLLTTPVVGKMEFLTDRLYFTQTSGTTRQQLAYVADIPNNATNQEIINASHVAFWGDSLTRGVGAPDANLPIDFAASTGYTTYNGGVDGETSTQVLARLTGATDKQGYATVIWVGRNDISQLVSPTTIKANIASMVSTIGHNRYIIMGVTKNSSEITGTTNATTINTLNSDLSTLYGTRFFDVQAYLLTQGNGTTQDNIDIGNGITPSSLRFDATHLNGTGYTLVSNQLVGKISILQPSDNNLITVNNAPTLSPYGVKQYSLATGGQYQIGGMQVLYLPPQGSAATVSNNFFVGDGGTTLTTGLNNTSLGITTLKSLTTGLRNTAIGAASSSFITTANDNVGVGFRTLITNIAGNGNTAIGNTVLSLATASFNTGVGFQALNNLSTGNNNVAVGANALFTQTTASQNVAVGFGAFSVLNGTGNVAVGYNAGVTQTGGAQNIFIGYNVNGVSITAGGQLNIANAIYGTNNLGVGSTLSTGNIGMYVQSPTARLHLPAGTISGNTAPLKLSSGTTLTTPENGAFEYDGTNLYFTIGGVRKTVTLI